LFSELEALMEKDTEGKGRLRSEVLFSELEALMAQDGVDYTILWRQLYQAARARAIYPVEEGEVFSSLSSIYIYTYRYT